MEPKGLEHRLVVASELDHCGFAEAGRGGPIIRALENSEHREPVFVTRLELEASEEVGTFARAVAAEGGSSQFDRAL